MQENIKIFTKNEEKHLEKILEKDDPTKEDIDYIDSLLAKAEAFTEDALKRDQIALASAKKEMQDNWKFMLFFGNLLTQSADVFRKFFLERKKEKQLEDDSAEVLKVKNSLLSKNKVI